MTVRLGKSSKVGFTVDSGLIKKLNGFLNVTEYNPVGDGGTDDTVAITNAVTDAYNQGKILRWPNATYLTTSNIPHLHQVQHEGKGIIKRGTNLFYVNPKGSLTNTLFVNPTGGVAGNDGLSANESPASLTEAFNNLSNYGPVLGGNWIIQLVAGTYKHAYLPSGLLSVNPITINGFDVGGYPNQPQTIVSDTTTGTGIYAEQGTRVIINNVFAKDYTSGNGFAVAYRSEMTLNNCWADNCEYAVQSMHQASITIPDGKLTNSVYGIYSLQQSNHYIGNQNATSVTNQLVIDTCTYGFCAKEFSTGHVNWITIQNCTSDGIYLYRLSSVNGDGILFKNNYRDVRTGNGSNWSPTDNTVYGQTSQSTVVNLDGHIGGDMYISGFDFNYNSSEKIYNIVNYNKSIQTTSGTYAQVSTLKAPHWKVVKNTTYGTVGKGINFRIHGAINGTTNTKRLEARISDGTNYQTVGTTFTAPTNGIFTAEGTLYILSATELFMVMKIGVNQYSNYVNTSRNTNIDLTKDLTFEVGGYVTDPTDSLKIEVVEMRTYG